MNGRYSLRDRVTDGPITAERWVHHLIKIGTHALASAGLFLVFRLIDRDGHVVRDRAIVSAALGGPFFWLLLAIHERIWPTDRQPLARWQHLADWMTDCALSCAPLVAVIWWRDSLAGVLLFGACFAAYMAGHEDARP